MSPTLSHHLTTMIPIPIALPLASCQPGPIHTTTDGRAWYGHGDRSDPQTGMIQEAFFRLTKDPFEGDDLWIDGNSITLPGAAPAVPAPPVEWPTIEELEQGIAECRAALEDHPDFYVAAAKARAETACWEAQRAVQAARIAVAEAEVAAAAREESEEIVDNAWLAASPKFWSSIGDPAGIEPISNPDIDDLDWNDHPSLTPAERN